jgi:hypothetical protein
MIFTHGVFAERTPFILEANFALGGATAASSTAAGFSPSAVVAENTWQSWKCGANDGWVQIDLGAPRWFDTMAVVGHNLSAIGANFNFAHKMLAGDAYTYLTGFAATDARPAVLLATTLINARYILCYVPPGATAPPSIACVMIGQRRRLPAWVMPPYARAIDAETVEGEAAISRGGHYMGATVRRRGGRLSPVLSPIERDWFDANLGYFRQHYSARRPFLWASSPTDHPSDVVYGWRGDGAGDLRAELIGGGAHVRCGLELDFHVA